MSDQMESQPTQILRDVLPDASKASFVDLEGGWRSKSQIANRTTSRSNAIEELSLDSIVPPMRMTAPCYQYHGLAETQPDSQGEAQPNSGSRKRELPSRNAKHDASNRIESTSTRNSRRDRPLRSANKSTKGSQQTNQGSKGPHRRSRLVDNDQRPPCPPNHSMPPPPMPRTNRSPSPSSQDSFAGAISQDDERHFLASTRQFNVPLSDLGETQQASQTESIPEAAQDYDDISFISAAMLAYSAEKARVSSVDPPRVAKKPWTPSYSATSSESSQISQFAQSQYRMRSSQDQPHSGASLEDQDEGRSFDDFTSSYERLLDRDSSQPTIHPDSESSQPPVLQATPELPSTQPDDDTTGEVESAIEGGGTAPSWLAPVNSSIAPSAPRSILSMVGQHKRWRLDRLLKQQGNQGLSAQPETQPAASTRSGVQDDTQYLYSRGDEHRLDVSEHKPAGTFHETRRAPALSDPTEIIPDSEPPRTDPQDEIFLHPSLPSPSLGRQSKVSLPKSVSEEIVEDSLERSNPFEGHQDDDETEMPLAAVLSAKHGQVATLAKPSSRPPGPTSRPSSSTNTRHRGTNTSIAASTPVPSNEEDAKEDEERTESAVDYDMEIDVKGEVVAGSSGKRKRAAETKSVRAVSRASTKTSKQSATPAPSSRPAKRLRSVASASRTVGMGEPATRVFALWKQDGHYYSGTVHSLHFPSLTRYLVRFDDNTEDVVDIARMRRCQLMVGDNVIVVEGGLRGRVSDIDQFETEGIARVEVDDGSKVSFLDIEASDIRIASRTLLSKWKDRMLDAESIVTIIKPKQIKTTPSPSKVSLMNTTTVQNDRKHLAKTGLVVTLSATNSNPDAERDSIIRTIKNFGGIVMEDWSNIFSMNGVHSQGNKRWVVSKDDLRWTPKTNVERVFLLSDDSSRKPKFLIALALGIPCVSFDWLTNGPVEEWQPHLLPAGYSEVLHARVSQLVDLDWGNSPEYLSDITSNTVASKLFKKKSVLCVGADFVPLPRAKKQGSSDEASRSVPHIILAMGAERVEAATEAKFSSSTDFSSFDYVVVKDNVNGEIVPPKHQGKTTIVCLSWVKDSLITGRLSSPNPDNV